MTIKDLAIILKYSIEISKEELAPMEAMMNSMEYFYELFNGIRIAMMNMSTKDVQDLEMIILIGREYCYRSYSFYKLSDAPDCLNLTEWREFLKIPKDDKCNTIEYIIYKPMFKYIDGYLRMNPELKKKVYDCVNALPDVGIDYEM